MTFACCGKEFLFKKFLNCSQTPLPTSYRSYTYSLNLSQSRVQKHMYQDNYNFNFIKITSSIFWLDYINIKLLLNISTCCLLWLSLFQFIFLFICNPSVCNPGPDTSVQFKTSSGLSVFYQNVQGLIPFSNLAEDHPQLDYNKIFELNAYINSRIPDIIILNETWLKPSILDSEIFPPDKYVIHRLDRSEKTHPIDPLNPKKYRRNGGGVLIAINISLSIESKTIPTNCSAELLAIELALPNKTKIILTTCYRVGTLGMSNCSEILSTLGRLSRKKMLRKFIVIGDFNLKGIDWASGNTRGSIEREFLNGFADLGLFQCINTATHDKGKTLDILLTTSTSYLKNLKIIDTERFCISDHYAITFSITEKVKRKQHVKRLCYNYKKANWKLLNEELEMINWENLLDYHEPEIAWQNFKKILFSKVDNHIPKFLVKNEHQPPWFDSECFKKCKEKDKLHKLFKLKNTLQAELKFKASRREFKTLIRSKMRANLDYCDRNILTKKFWSHVKSSKNSSRIPEVISYEGITANEPLAKANMFNQYFYKQFSGPSCYDTNIDFTNDSTFDIDLSDSRIKPLLDNLDINKAQGPDAVSGAVLKNCSKTLAYPLSILFNLSYNTGYIPQEWKLANVVPVHKKDDKNKVTNYRPISLTSLVMKVFERILYDELLTRTIDKIDTRQHGFLRNRSCNSNLLLFTESIVRSLHEKIGTDVIYFDFAKAFDTVSHDLILNKLKTQYNIDGTLLKFFTEYLCSRKQRVILDNVISECVDVLSGVPQGSILGPLLFVLFINDIYTNIDKDTNIALFADDTKIWRDINSEADCEILQNDINTLSTWSRNNKMSFHPDKCKALSIHDSRPDFVKVLPFPYCYYNINGNIIEFCENERDLGVLVSSNFRWDDQHDKILKKAHQMLGFIKRTCHFILDARKRRSLYLSLVRSNFEHGSIIWRPVTETEISDFEKLQKRALKWIFKEENMHYNDETYIKKCCQANLTPMKIFFDINDLTFFHKIVYENVPILLPEYIKPYTGQGRLRQANLDSLSYVCTFTSSSYPSSRSPFYKSFFYRVIHSWNSIPLNLRIIENIHTFKRQAICHYLNAQSMI